MMNEFEKAQKRLNSQIKVIKDAKKSLKKKYQENPDDAENLAMMLMLRERLEVKEKERDMYKNDLQYLQRYSEMTARTDSVRGKENQTQIRRDALKAETDYHAFLEKPTMRFNPVEA